MSSPAKGKSSSPAVSSPIELHNCSFITGRYDVSSVYETRRAQYPVDQARRILELFEEQCRAAVNQGTLVDDLVQHVYEMRMEALRCGVLRGENDAMEEIFRFFGLPDRMWDNPWSRINRLLRMIENGTAKPLPGRQPKHDQTVYQVFANVHRLVRREFYDKWIIGDDLFETRLRAFCFRTMVDHQQETTGRYGKIERRVQTGLKTQVGRRRFEPLLATWTVEPRTSPGSLEEDEGDVRLSLSQHALSPSVPRVSITCETVRHAIPKMEVIIKDVYKVDDDWNDVRLRNVNLTRETYEERPVEISTKSDHDTTWEPWKFPYDQIQVSRLNDEIEATILSGLPTRDTVESILRNCETIATILDHSRVASSKNSRMAKDSTEKPINLISWRYHRRKRR